MCNILKMNESFSQSAAHLMMRSCNMQQLAQGRNQQSSTVHFHYCKYCETNKISACVLCSTLQSMKKSLTFEKHRGSFDFFSGLATSSTCSRKTRKKVSHQSSTFRKLVTKHDPSGVFFSAFKLITFKKFLLSFLYPHSFFPLKLTDLSVLYS